MCTSALIRLAIPLSLILTASCSTTRTIARGQPFQLSKKATLLTADGAEIRVRNIHINGDSLTARGADGVGKIVKLHVSDVRSIMAKNRGRGARRGLLFGVAGGAAIGYLLGEDDASDALASRGEGAIIYGAFGLMLGPAIGYAMGHTETYHFEQGARSAGMVPGNSNPNRLSIYQARCRDVLLRSRRALAGSILYRYHE